MQAEDHSKSSSYEHWCRLQEADPDERPDHDTEITAEKRQDELPKAPLEAAQDVSSSQAKE